MKIRVQDGLPFVTVTLNHQGQQIVLEKIILDTGSSGTLFPVDRVAAIGLVLEPHDTLSRIRGVGGSEFVFSKQVDSLSIGELEVHNFQVEIGAMEYGFDLEGIIGMDFLIQARAIIDLHRLEIYQDHKQG